MSWRRFAALARHLPVESATAMAAIGPAADWSVEAHLLASLVDAVQQSNYLFALAHTPKGKTQPRRPRRFPRPGVKPDDDGERRFGSKRGTFRTPAEFDAAYKRAVERATFVEEEVNADVSGSR